ncbi:hypothetical protein BDY19DRAFT_153309 [Irpex rosettiformis]|uniref:Uncharacterized protein n=1 Tax=Irpex rosettiformis TaxID=378272 RepID=A0ACB8U3N0_9APHY|nr:hypothetical protein BDY19DRAFT_153309 [Irpex rosettiformis]
MANSSTVIREVTQDVWTFSRPFARFGLFPIGGRSTAIKLKTGGVWVLASTPLDDETRTKLQELGPVRYIVGADAVHYLFLAQYRMQYPEAKLIAPQDAIDTVSKVTPDVNFDGAWGKDDPDTKYGFEDEINHCYFPGHQNKEVAFLHKESKTLLEADLLFNLPPTEQYSKSKESATVPFISSHMNPFSGLHKRMVWSIARDKEAMKRDLKTIRGWDFDRIIPCHGDVIEKDGKAAFEELFKWFF